MAEFQRAREFALSLPGVSEQPHFDKSSFRVNGKIFVTVPPGEAYLHVFVDEAETEASVAEDPAAFAPLLWGTKQRGLRVTLAAVDGAPPGGVDRGIVAPQGPQAAAGRARLSSQAPASPGR